MDGFPAGRTPSHLTRRRLMQWGAAGAASIYARQGTRLGADLGVRRRGGRRPGEEVRRPAVPGGRQRRPQHRPARVAAPTTRAYVDARPFIHRGQGANAADGRVGSWQMPGPAGAALAFANCTVSGAAQQRRHGRLRHALRRRHRRPGLQPRGDARGRRQEVHALSHFDNSDLWFEASADLNNKTGWLGRWIDRNGDANNPLQAVSLDTALSKAIRTTTMPVSRDQLAADDRLQADRQPAAVRIQQHADLERRGQQARRRSRSARATTTSPARAATYGLTYKTSLLAGGAYAPPAGSYPTTTPTGTTLTTLSKRLQMAAHMIDVLGHPDHHDPLGRLRHPHEPARQPGQAVQGALARAGRLPGRPARPA